MQILEDQLNLLNDLAIEIFTLLDGKEHPYRYEYKFNPDEGWAQFGLYFTKNSEMTSVSLNEISFEHLIPLCEKLHQVMNAHTGGDWRKFILDINEKKEVKTNFIYEIQSCMDEFND